MFDSTNGIEMSIHYGVYASNHFIYAAVSSSVPFMFSSIYIVQGDVFLQ